MLVRGRHVRDMAGQYRARMARDDLLRNELLVGRSVVLDGRSPGQDGRRRNCGAELEPLPAGQELPPRLGRIGHARANPARQLRRRPVIGEVFTERPSQPGLPGEYRPAGFAGRQVLIDRHDARDVQLLIDIRVQAATDIGAFHAHDSCRACCRCCSSSLRARARRDITVPSGMSATAAISL